MQQKRHISSIVFTGMALMFTAFLFVYPQQSLEAGARGISIWWEVLFPALFPFFVLSELMLGLGLVHFAGTLLDPMMRPVFRVPGKGGFVMAMGFASGYPVGARLTSRLWAQKLVNREEGERLVAFTSTSDPIFLIGAVSVGFFHSPELALVLAIVHYFSGIVVGWLMRFHGRGSMSAETPAASNASGGVLKRAFYSMHRARIEDGRSFWTLLSEAVRSSIMLVFMIGGLVVFFSVLIEVAEASSLLPKITAAIGTLLSLFGLPSGLASSLVNGLFEVTLGAKTAAQAGELIALQHKVAIASIVLAWAGLSVHAQIVSLLNQTNLRYTPFVIARFIHAAIAFILVFVLWEPLYTVSSVISSNTTIIAWLPEQPSRLSTVPLAFVLFFLMFGFFIAATALLYAAGKLINRTLLAFGLKRL